MCRIQVSASLFPDIRIVGKERTPVIVIDEPISSTEELIRFATQSATFESDDRVAYPGVRAELPRSYIEALWPELVTLMIDVYKIPARYKHSLHHQAFSLVSKKPESLAPLQRIPHYDSLSSNYFATVHYLNPGCFAGTGIFRHRPTGYERISEHRFPDYVRAAESHMKLTGMPIRKYINSSDDHYELVAEIEYRPNRLILYPGNLLHSPLIITDRDIDADPATGRLTANLFIDCFEESSR